MSMSFTLLLIATLPTATPAAGHDCPLAGTWELRAADKQLPGGELARDYGEHPQGRLHIDAEGRYALQILRAERLRFADPDKAKGTAAEFQSAVLGSSAHFGTVSVDHDDLVFAIAGASFPNWEGTVQRRSFACDGQTLRYRVPARPDGSVPISVWTRMK